MTTPPRRSATTGKSIADMIPQWFEGGTQEQMLDEAFAQIRTLEASAQSAGKIELFLLNRGQAIDADVGSYEAAMEAIDKVIQDAARYRWLRVQKHADIAACWYLPAHCDPKDFDTPEARDAAIDAAIQAVLGGERA